jgi:hypothetical protein
LPPDVAIIYQHVTDLYLLGLAIHRQGRLATLDQRIPASLLESGVQALELIEV